MIGRYDEATDRWEHRILPESSWDSAEETDGLTIHRTTDGAVAAVQVDGLPDEEVLDRVRSFLVGDRAVPPAPVGALVDDDGWTFSLSDDAPIGVDRTRRGDWSFDASTSRAHISVPIRSGATDLWVSVVDMATGDVLAAGALSPEGETALTLGVPFRGDEVRIDVGRVGPETIADVPAGWGRTAALPGVLALVLAAVVAGLSVATDVVVASMTGLGAIASGLAMVAELVVSVFLIERLWRFPLLRSLVGFVVVAGAYAYSNLMYSMLNLGGGWDTWYSGAAERIQESAILLLPLAAVWAMVWLLRRGAR